MSTRRSDGSIPIPKPANDNQPPTNHRLRVVVQIAADLPITQTEIEVFASLLDDWVGQAANDNEGPGG